MNRIVEKTVLSDSVYKFIIEASDIANSRKPGQFVIVMPPGEYEERIPLTIADADSKNGTITLIFQAVGGSTLKLSKLKVGESIPHVLGPLGMPTHLEKHSGRIICVAGGIGAAPLYPIVQGLKGVGNRVEVILGARDKDLLILEKEMEEASDRVTVITDNGSKGRKGLVTEPLEDELKKGDVSLVISIGPPIMMKYATLVAKKFNTPAVVSLNTIMVDGTGMCGGCRVNVGNEVKFVCVDGPEFDGHLVDFDNMILRQSSYKKHEEHRCNLERVC